MSKSEALNVRYKYRIIYIEALIEKSDPKIIHLRAKDNNGIIYFDCHLNDSKNSLSFKEKIDKVRRDLKDKDRKRGEEMPNRGDSEGSGFF